MTSREITNEGGIKLQDVLRVASEDCMTRDCISISISAYRYEALVKEEELAWISESRDGLRCPASLSRTRHFMSLEASLVSGHFSIEVV